MLLSMLSDTSAAGNQRRPSLEDETGRFVYRPDHIFQQSRKHFRNARHLAQTSTDRLRVMVQGGPVRGFIEDLGTIVDTVLVAL
jgi:hypothetical protein